MVINELHKIPGNDQNTKLFKAFSQFEQVLVELKRKELPDEIIVSINNDIEGINTFNGADKDFIKRIRKTQSAIIKLIEKKLKIVPKNHYRNTLLAVGIATGVAVGITIGSSTGNMSLLAMGITIGMAIGMAAGTSKDKKAKDSGKQLDLEIKN